MIAQELEVSLHMAFVEARQQRHEFITVEHLLLALQDNPSAAEVLRACSANIDDLRKSLGNFIKDNTPQVAGTDDINEREAGVAARPTPVPTSAYPRSTQPIDAPSTQVTSISARAASSTKSMATGMPVLIHGSKASRTIPR